MTQAQLISLLGQLPINEANRSMFEAIISTINSLTTSDGTKQFPTALTIADINKAISIDTGGNAVLYENTVVNSSQLGVWTGQVSNIPAGPGATILLTITNAADVQVNITKDDIINAGPFAPPADATEFATNLVTYINATFPTKYFAFDNGGGLFDIFEIVNGTIAASITTTTLDIVVTPTTPSVVQLDYYDTKPLDGILVGIADNGNAIVDVTNFVYIKLGANASAGDLLFIGNGGLARPGISGDDANSTVVQGKILIDGVTGAVVPCTIAAGSYSTLIQLQLAVAAIGDLDSGNVLFVDYADGDDGSAELGNPGKPWQTLAAATAAYAAGNLVYVRSGDHFVNSQILVDGLQMYCEPECRLISGAQFFNADTTAGGVTITSPVRIMGHAIMNDADGGGGGFLTVRTNPLAEFRMNFQSVTVANISNGMVLRDGTTYLNVEEGYSCGGRPFRLQDTANLYANIGGNVTSTFGSVFNSIIYSDGMSWSGTAKIKAKSFLMPGAVNGQHYCRFTGCSGAKIQIELDELLDDATGFDTPFAHCDSGTIEVSLSIKKCSMVARPLYNVINSNVTFILYDTGGTIEGATQTAGVVKWKNVDVDLQGGVSNSVNCTGTGKLVMDNVKIDSRAFSLSNITLDATSTAILRNVNLMIDGALYPVDNQAGSTLTCMDAFFTHNLFDNLTAVGQFYINAAFTD